MENKNSSIRGEENKVKNVVSIFSLFVIPAPRGWWYTGFTLSVWMSICPSLYMYVGVSELRENMTCSLMTPIDFCLDWAIICLLVAKIMAVDRTLSFFAFLYTVYVFKIWCI